MFKIKFILLTVLISITIFIFFKYKPTFRDVSNLSMVKFDNYTAGISWTDFNVDGKLDLFVSGMKAKLYKNNGNGHFTDVSKNAGLDFEESYVQTGIFADYDNDGCADLFVTISERRSKKRRDNKLFHNNCDSTFTDVTKSSDLGQFESSWSAVAWADYDNDGFVDLYITNMGIFSKIKDSQLYNYASVPDVLYRNNRDGTFSNVNVKSGLGNPSTCGVEPMSLFTVNKIISGPQKLSVQPIWFDYNDDGKIDLFVATQFGVSPLYRNNGDTTFTEVTNQAGLCRLGSNMGVSVGDYDNDGDLDLYTTNIGANFFWKNNGDGTFREIAAETRTSAYDYMSWGINFFDYNNDGYLDLYLVNGPHRSQGKKASGKPDSKADPNIKDIGMRYLGNRDPIDMLFKNNGDNTFTEVGPKEGIAINDENITSAIGDYNDDGFDDLATDYNLDRKKTYKLFKNTPNGNHWLTLQLVGTKSNRDSVGARIWVTTGDKTQMREIISGSSYLSQNSLWQTFGLGKTNKIDKIKIRWPNGTIRTLYNVKADQKIVVKEY